MFGAILCDALDDQRRVFARTRRVRLLANHEGQAGGAHGRPLGSG
jgi:hypothetical protein